MDDITHELIDAPLLDEPVEQQRLTNHLLLDLMDAMQLFAQPMAVFNPGPGIVSELPSAPVKIMVKVEIEAAVAEIVRQAEILVVGEQEYERCESRKHYRYDQVKLTCSDCVREILAAK